MAKGNPEAILKKRVIELLRAGFEAGQLDYTKGNGRFLADKVNARIPVTGDVEEPNGL